MNDITADDNDAKRQAFAKAQYVFEAACPFGVVVVHLSFII